MGLALASMASGRTVDPNIAVTGEVTLTGQVLPVGGIKEKVLAAKAAGITRVYLPDRNEADVDEIRGEDLLEGLEFRFVDHLDQVLNEALLPKRPTRKRAARSAKTTKPKTKRSSSTSPKPRPAARPATKEPTAATSKTSDEARDKAETPRVYAELDHPADLLLEIWGIDLDRLFQNSLFALYDNLAQLEGFAQKEHVDVEVEGTTLSEALRSLLSEALYRFSTEGFVASGAQVSVDASDPNRVHVTARLSGEKADKLRHTLLAEVKAVTYHQLTVDRTPEGGWRATVLLDV